MTRGWVHSIDFLESSVPTLKSLPKSGSEFLAENEKGWIAVENQSFCQRDEEKTRHEAGKNDLEGSGCL